MLAKWSASAVVLLLLSAPVIRAQSPQQSKVDDESTASNEIPFGPALVGTWRASTERLPLTGDFNEQVWGRNAVSVRDVSLAVKPTGDASLTISRKVLDSRGRVVPGSASIEQAELTIGAAKPGFATRLDHAVKMVKAERRYPDNANDRWTLENLRVNVVSFTDTRDRLEVRFDPGDGQGAFAEVLTRHLPARRAKR